MDTFKPRWTAPEESDEAFEARFREAARRGWEAARNEPHAAAIAFDAGTRTLTLTLTNGRALTFDPAAVPELAGLTDTELADGRVLGAGGGIGWDAQDVHVSVPGLVLLLTFGPEWRRTMRGYLNAELAGAKSEAKAAAARANGKKGGRPRKTAVAEPAPQASANAPTKRSK